MRIARADVADASPELWRTRTGESAKRLAHLKAELSGKGADEARIARATVTPEKPRPLHRLTGLGTMLAKLGPFDAWMLATVEEGTLRVSASAEVIAPQPVIIAQGAPASALTECFQRQSNIVRTAPASQSRPSCRRRHLRALCRIPLCSSTSGAIGLAASESIDDAAIARIEAVAVRINPSIDKSLAEAENDRLRGLERNLGRGMFGATAAERARIARDLHDHQAQPLAAARTRIAAGSANEKPSHSTRARSAAAAQRWCDQQRYRGKARPQPQTAQPHREHIKNKLDLRLMVRYASKHSVVKSARKGLPRFGRRKSGKGSPFDLRSIPLRSG